MQGKKQTALAIQRYHILCAAIQGKYKVLDIIPIADQRLMQSDERRYVHATIDFSAYKEFKLRPIKDAELPELVSRMDCEIVDIGIYSMARDEDWRLRQGGILFAVGEYGDFFNCVTAYRTTVTGDSFIEEWNTLFGQLRSSQYRKNIIPCMFFGQKDGCLDQNCPFLHDRETALAVRAQILKTRRQRVTRGKYEPTERQRIARYHAVLDCMSGGDEALRAKIAQSRQVNGDIGEDRAYCANPRCMKPWKKGENRKLLKACKRCKFTMCCSPECQKQDWPRHKKDPCAPLEEIIEDDNLWNPVGFQKGTNIVKTLKDVTRKGFDPDA
jgi:hypothetical protein